MLFDNNQTTWLNIHNVIIIPDSKKINSNYWLQISYGHLSKTVVQLNSLRFTGMFVSSVEKIFYICDPKSKNRPYGAQNFQSTVSVQPARIRL